MGNEEVTQRECEDNTGEEDTCEKIVVTLSALPVTNNPAYRQENEQYFVTKKYVSQRQVCYINNDIQGAVSTNPVIYLSIITPYVIAFLYSTVLTQHAALFY